MNTSPANTLSSLSFNPFVFCKQKVNIKKFILPKTLTTISPYFIYNGNINRNYHFVDTIMVTNTDSVINVVIDSILGKRSFEVSNTKRALQFVSWLSESKTNVENPNWQQYLNKGMYNDSIARIYDCSIKWDSVVALVPNKLLSKYKQNPYWKTLQLIGYNTDSSTNSINQIISDETKPKIYPTVVTNTLNISGINQGNIIIYDLNGNAILRKEVQPQIDVSDLPKGIYLVSINNLCIGKIVK